MIMGCEMSAHLNLFSLMRSSAKKYLLVNHSIESWIRTVDLMVAMSSEKLPVTFTTSLILV